MMGEQEQTCPECGQRLTVQVIRMNKAIFRCPKCGYYKVDGPSW